MTLNRVSLSKITSPLTLSSRRSMLATQLLHVIPETCRKHFFSSSSSSSAAAAVLSRFNVAFRLTTLSAPHTATAGMPSVCHQHTADYCKPRQCYVSIIITDITSYCQMPLSCKHSYCSNAANPHYRQMTDRKKITTAKLTA